MIDIRDWIKEAADGGPVGLAIAGSALFCASISHPTVDAEDLMQGIAAYKDMIEDDTHTPEQVEFFKACKAILEKMKEKKVS